MPSPAPLGDHRSDPYLGGVIPPSWPGFSPDQTDPERLTGGFLTRCLNLHRCFEEVWAQLNPIQLFYWTQWLNIKTLIWQHRILVPLHVGVWPGCFCLLSRIFLSPTAWLKLATGLESSCFYSFYRPWPLCQEGTNTKDSHVGNKSVGRGKVNVVHRVYWKRCARIIFCALPILPPVRGRSLVQELGTWVSQ